MKTITLRGGQMDGQERKVSDEAARLVTMETIGDYDPITTREGDVIYHHDDAWRVSYIPSEDDPAVWVFDGRYDD